MNKSGFITGLALVFTGFLMMILIFELQGFKQQELAYHRLINYYATALCDKRDQK